MSEPEPLCNLCGLSCVLGCEGHPCRGPHGLINAAACGGYESTPGNGHGALDDSIRYTFNLCEFCLDWLFSWFKVPVVTDDYMDNGLIPGATPEESLQRPITSLPPWRSAVLRVMEDDWRRQKQEFYEEHARRSKARNEGPWE